MFVLILSNNHTTTIYTSKSQAEHGITRAGYISNSSRRVSKLIFLCISAGPSGIIHVLHECVAMDVHYETLILQSFAFSFFYIKRIQSEQLSKRKSEFAIQDKNHKPDKNKNMQQQQKIYIYPLKSSE